MASDRREFLQQAAVIGIGTTGASLLTPRQRATPLPTARAAALMKAFDLNVPIFQAGMGATANPDLAIAVSTAGAMGALGMAGASAEAVRERVSRVRAGTRRPFSVNYLLSLDFTTLGVALDAGAPIVQFAWGIPSRDAVSAIRKAGAKMGVQIGSAEGARRALDLGADYLICQGTEAGGHVQGTRSLDEALPRVLVEAKETPVLAGGGIASGQAIRRALVAGAAGVLIGTRFVATKEADAHDVYKRALTEAKAEDTVLTICFQDGWANAPHRALRNATFKMWEAAGCPKAGARPGEGDVVATGRTGNTFTRYRVNPPTQAMNGGGIAEMALYAGQGVDAIRDIPSAADLVARLWADCVADKS